MSEKVYVAKLEVEQLFSKRKLAKDHIIECLPGNYNVIETKTNSISYYDIDDLIEYVTKERDRFESDIDERIHFAERIQDEYMTTRDVAYVCNKTKTTLYTYYKKKKRHSVFSELPNYKVLNNRRVLWRTDEILAFLKKDKEEKMKRIADFLIDLMRLKKRGTKSFLATMIKKHSSSV